MKPWERIGKIHEFKNEVYNSRRRATDFKRNLIKRRVKHPAIITEAGKKAFATRRLIPPKFRRAQLAISNAGQFTKTKLQARCV